GNDGPLAITDCNAVLGRLRPAYFPRIFGPNADQPLAIEASRARFEAMAAEVEAATGQSTEVEGLAEGFLDIACDNMANAIKKISVQRGHDVSTYALVCFGGAGGQHACRVADNLGIERILIHPHAGVLSAVGIGLADVRTVAEQTVGTPLDDDRFRELTQLWASLEAQGRRELAAEGVAEGRIEATRRLAIRYAGSDTSLFVEGRDPTEATAAFEAVHRARFGFTAPDLDLEIDTAQVEVIGRSEVEAAMATTEASASGIGDPELGRHPMWAGGRSHDTPFLDRSALAAGRRLDGPAVVVEATATTVVEPGWAATLTEAGDLVLERVEARPDATTTRTEVDPTRGRHRSTAVDPVRGRHRSTAVDPVRLEIFNNLFMNIAEQMGVVLENTAISVNIKERLDFSCAVFGPDGDLVANAPHMPVHLGSMSESIKSTIARNPAMKPGDVYVMNAPYQGGTHLPDITVIKPIYRNGEGAPIFYVASRGHHADVGGSVPGSAPCDSTTIEEEGVLLDNVLLVEHDRWQEDTIRAELTGGRYPARNPDQNIADLKAQVAACERGAAELARVIDHYGLDVVHAYMAHVKDNAEESVRRVISALRDASFVSRMDDGSQIAVAITVDEAARSAVIDFTGTSRTHPRNFNAPPAVAFAAVLYVFRCLVDDNIPLNAGCMKPLELILPEDSMINPTYPAAVIAGNVETSQIIVQTLFGALGTMAAAQGTMNNTFWGNDIHQYYETVCGGSGATPRADGCSAVHTHMTNSRLTDPEVLEQRFPVVLESFSVRHGSGGGGKWRGGDGTIRRVRFEEAMELNVISSHREVAPYGLAGGEPGAVGRNRVIRADGSVVELAGADRADLAPGDVFELHTPGGGGYGSPDATEEDRP
ncbi:MAG: hydantoinase B/oxoprolinase family protein, partial [Actinomycetota bacterium]